MNDRCTDDMHWCAFCHAMDRETGWGRDHFHRCELGPPVLGGWGLGWAEDDAEERRDGRGEKKDQMKKRVEQGWAGLLLLS